jgi:hypothetical protein
VKQKVFSSLGGWPGLGRLAKGLVLDQCFEQLPAFLHTRFGVGQFFPGGAQILNECFENRNMSAHDSPPVDAI